MTTNREEFDKVTAELEAGEPLTITKMARVFGFPCYELILHALLSAAEASNVIREAVAAAAEQEANVSTDHVPGN